MVYLGEKYVGLLSDHLCRLQVNPPKSAFVRKIYSEPLKGNSSDAIQRREQGQDLGEKRVRNASAGAKTLQM